MTTYFFFIAEIYYYEISFPVQCFLGVNNCLIFFHLLGFLHTCVTSSSSYSLNNSVKLFPLSTNTSGIFSVSCFFLETFFMEPCVSHSFLDWLFCRLATQSFSWNFFSLSHWEFFYLSPLLGFIFWIFHVLLSWLHFYFNEVYLCNVSCEGGEYFKTVYTWKFYPCTDL